jgi:hypothetical protein
MTDFIGWAAAGAAAAAGEPDALAHQPGERRIARSTMCFSTPRGMGLA